MGPDDEAGTLVGECNSLILFHELRSNSEQRVRRKVVWGHCCFSSGVHRKWVGVLFEGEMSRNAIPQTACHPFKVGDDVLGGAPETRCDYLRNHKELLLEM